MTVLSVRIIRYNREGGASARPAPDRCRDISGGTAAVEQERPRQLRLKVRDSMTLLHVRRIVGISYVQFRFRFETFSTPQVLCSVCTGARYEMEDVAIK